MQILISIWSLCGATAIAAEAPADFVKLQKRFHEVVMEKSKPIFRKLDADLKKLQDSYLRNGQTNSARQVAEVRKSGIPEEGAESLPERLQTLINRYDLTRRNALRSVEQTYQRELLKLKKKYARAGNLEAVEAIEKELEASQPKEEKAEVKEFTVESLVGEWEVYFNGKLQGTRRTFDETHLHDNRGARYPWKFVAGNKAVYIDFHNDKAGSYLNLVRWVNPRTIKETFVPPTDFTYPFMK